MSDAVAEWVVKAEEDFLAANSLHRLRRARAHNAVCFHAQQCVEKYLKAILEGRRVTVRKLHSLPVLLDECVEAQPLLAPMRPDMVRLSVLAVEFRYLGESATEDDARTALAIMRGARRDLRAVLGLTEP